MASEIVASHAAKTFRVPKSLLTSPNSIAIENAWDYSYGTPETTFKRGDLLVVDLDACPKQGDVVVMCREGKQPFGRRCFLAPLAADKREHWVMGVLDQDGDSIYTFDLGKYSWFGVVTGKVPAAERRA